MKAILFIAAFAFCTFCEAQDPFQNITAADTSSSFLIRLKDRTSLSGKIIERNENEIVFFDITIGKVTIPINKIDNITKYSVDQICILTTSDGKVFSGVLISLDETSVTIKTESLGQLTISNSKIKNLKIVEKEQIVNGKYFFPNPHPTRYFFGPSAIPLKKGEGYFQNAWILSNSFQLGVSDHFSMGGGMVIPILFYITPKIGYKVGDNTYLGGGILVASSFSSDNLLFGIAVGYASATFGNEENNFTINAGWGAVKEDNYNFETSTSTTSWKFSRSPIFAFSGMMRIAPKFALISENWVFATKEYSEQYQIVQDYTYKYHAVLSGGFRFLGEKNSFDFGLALPWINDRAIGIPYLDYVFKF